MSSFSFNFIPTGSSGTSSQSSEGEGTMGPSLVEDMKIDARSEDIKVVSCPPSWAEAKRLQQIPSTALMPFPGGAGDSSGLRRLDPQSNVFSPAALQSRGVPPESDLVPGSYGGGYKVWECSFDLIEYVLASSSKIKEDMVSLSRGMRILELGCGHGLPGIASFVHLQAESLLLTDLNDGVLEDVTWPNVLLNCSNEQQQSVKCISGDWMKLPDTLRRQEGEASLLPFDLILSAETLYTEENCRSMLTLLQQCLSGRAQGGVALLANKRYYFGVGGGTSELERIADTEFPSTFRINRVKEFVDGSSNIRDILAVILA